MTYPGVKWSRDLCWTQGCCEALRSAILATAWLLVSKLSHSVGYRSCGRQVTCSATSSSTPPRLLQHNTRPVLWRLHHQQPGCGCGRGSNDADVREGKIRS